MSFSLHRVTPVSLPSESRIVHAYSSTDYADAYSVELPTGASTDPELLARFIFEQPSPVASFLLKIRDVLVGGFGLKTAKHMSLNAENDVTRIAIFRIYSVSQAEIILGEDDKHLDFRVSVLCSDQQPQEGNRRVTLSTVVHYNNCFGHLYFFVIAPFHRLLVQSGLRRAARLGWPPAAEA